MEINIFILLIAYGLTLTTLLGCIGILLKHILSLNRQLRETVREYKIFQAAKVGDLTTVRSMKGVFQKPTTLTEITAAGEDSESAGVIITQKG